LQRLDFFRMQQMKKDGGVLVTDGKKSFMNIGHLEKRTGTLNMKIIPMLSWGHGGAKGITQKF
jgi:hypothetical protein